MPSPFPGMDPFIEGDCWRDFHTRLITALSEVLIDQLRPRYVVHVEEYAYFTDESERSIGLTVPDVRIAETEEHWRSPEGSTATAVATHATVHAILMPEQIEQTYLEIRSARLRKLVTVVEILSPTNKEPGKGRDQYLQKRANVLWSMANLVELDLVRAIAAPGVVHDRLRSRGVRLLVELRCSLDPPLNDADTKWVRETLSSLRSPAS